MPREAEWEARWWSPVINAEHLAMRDACGLIDLSAFAVFDITGPAALETVQSLAVAQLDVAPGGSSTPRCWTSGAGSRPT